MSEMYDIVSESMSEIQNELLTTENIQKEVENAYDENHELDFNKLMTVVIKISTSTSNNVLLKSLEKLESKGYLTKD